MTLQEAKSIARHLGLTLRIVRSGDYRVLDDAVNTAIEMARTRNVMKAVDETMASDCEGEKRK